VLPTDKQLLDKARHILKTTEWKLGAAQLIAMILTQFRAPIGGNDPYCRKRGKNKGLQLGK
jgi:hypothetical protein